jgi:hypothetical protein
MGKINAKNKVERSTWHMMRSAVHPIENDLAGMFF